MVSYSYLLEHLAKIGFMSKNEAQALLLAARINSLERGRPYPPHKFSIHTLQYTKGSIVFYK